MDKHSLTFVGRKKELSALEEMYKRPGSIFLPIYGRRRVGKSELILQFLKGRQGIYFLGKQAAPELQKQEFLAEAARVLDEPLLASLASENWKKIFQAVIERIPKNRKFIIALDEFQWTAEYSPELPSVLQELWDQVWSKQSRIFLILCGSYVGFMEREVLGQKSPLYGRRTGQIFLKPLSYLESALFHPRYSLVDQARVYFLCGGIPLYLKNFKQDLSVETNLMLNFLDEFAPLFREADFLLREELKEVERYYSILTLMASGIKTMNHIAVEMKMDQRKLYYYLQNLVELGYVKRKYPLCGVQPSDRSVRFELSDPLLRFWFRFIYSQMSAILHLGQERAFKEKISTELDSYFGGCFEELCKESLPAIYRKENVVADFEIGEYWDKQSQTDVIGLRKDGFIDIGECKWGDVSSLPNLVQELQKKMQLYPNPKNATLQGRIFVRKKIRSKPNFPFKIHTLEELYHLK